MSNESLAHAIEVETAAEAPAPAVITSAVVDRAGFQRALDAVARVAEKRTHIPILGNVLIQATDRGVKLSATNLDMEATFQVDGAADDGFAATVPVHKLLDVVKKAKASDMIGLRADPLVESVEFDFAGLRVNLNSMPAADFPHMNPAEFTHRFAILRTDFLRMLDKVADCISSEATRYYLCGVFLHPVVTPDGSVLRGVATDGHRLCHYGVPLPIGSGNMPGVILPSALVYELQRHLKPTFEGKGKDKRLIGPERADVRVNAAKIEVTIGDITLTSKLVDGTFPDYGRVVPMPEPTDYVVTTDRLGMIDAVKQVACISDVRGKAVRLSMLETAIRLTVTGEDFGSATMDVPATFGGRAEESPGFEIGANSSYIVTALDNLESETVTLRFKDPGSPFHFVDNGDPALVSVLMPMRV